MNRLLLLLSFGMVSLHSYGQEENGRSLHYYIETAKENSPLITDYRNQRAIEQTELENLKKKRTKKTDPRFAGLSKLIKKGDGENGRIL